MQIKSVLELSWLTTQQIVVTSDKEGSEIKVFGSGFFFQYRDRLFLVTADHVSHRDDFDAGMRLGIDNYVWVLNNKNSKKELATLLTPVGGFFSFDRSDITDTLSLLIPEMKDISFAILPNLFEYPFLTHELRAGEQIIVPAGEKKVVINFQCATEIKDTDYCLVEGCVHCEIKGMRFIRCNAIHQDMTLKGTDNDGYYVLKHSCPVVYKDWAGLSGAPVFNNNGRLIGMVIRVDESQDTITVVPMKKITELMDYAIQYEDSQIDTTKQ